MRVWTAVDYRNGRFRNPIWGRLEYMRGFFPLIDLIAVLPAVLGFFGGADLRVLRLLRLLRMIKLTRHSTVFGLLWAVLRQEARAIAALIFVLCLTLTVSGALMYMIEGDVQPNVFSSIPASMWWGDRNGDDRRLWRHGPGDVCGARPRRHGFNHRLSVRWRCFPASSPLAISTSCVCGGHRNIWMAMNSPARIAAACSGIRAPKQA